MCVHFTYVRFELAEVKMLPYQAKVLSRVHIEFVADKDNYGLFAWMSDIQNKIIMKPFFSIQNLFKTQKLPYGISSIYVTVCFFEI